MKLTEDQQKQINYLYDHFSDNDDVTDTICKLLDIIGIEYKERYNQGRFFLRFDSLIEGDAE